MKTRYKQITEMDKEEMTKFLCNLTEAILNLADIDGVCNYCPAQKYCKIGHTGYQDWLDEASINYENL